MGRFRTSLLAGVSALALAITAPAGARAGNQPAQLPLPAKLPPFVPKPSFVPNKWSWWVEGGPSYLSGDPLVPGLTDPPFDASAQGWGGEIGAGVDYRLDAFWQLSAQFRYGRYGPRTETSSQIARFQVVSDLGPASMPWPGSNSADSKEEHWLADFMVGRDLGVGSELPLVGKFGVRIAEINGKTDGSARWGNVPVAIYAHTVSKCTTAPTPILCASHERDYVQWNSFLGIGPRLELDGTIPLAERWGLHFMAGVAGLYGRRKATQTVNVNQTGGYAATPTPVVILSGGASDAAASDRAWVLNCDAMLGLSYAITANYSLMVSYRFDGYWNALKGFDQNGQPVNLDRFYQGVMVRLTLAD